MRYIGTVIQDGLKVAEVEGSDASFVCRDTAHYARIYEPDGPLEAQVKAIEERAYCTNCGSELNPFGICPNVPPEEVRIMAAPVYCGPKSHPDGCACKRCELTRELCAEVAA